MSVAWQRVAGMETGTLTEIEQALRDGWAADTCSPDDVERAAWTPENPAWGHCDITALLLHDLFGGELVVGEVWLGGEQHGYHTWNRLPGGVDVDLTAEQFRRGRRVVAARSMGAPPAGPLPRRGAAYRLLRQRVEERLGCALPAPRREP